MLCNGAVHLNNDTFLGVQQDVAHRVMLVTSSVSYPVVSQPINRACLFGVCPSMSLKGGDDDDDRQPAAQHKLIASPGGLLVVALSSLSDHHYLIDSIKNRVTEFTTPHGEKVIAGAWVPTQPHLFVVLFATANMMVLDMAKAFVGAVVVPSAMRDLAKIVTENMQFKEASRVNALAEQRILHQHVPTAADLRKPSPILTRFVHMTLVEERTGLPTMMLLLTLEGAVYAVKLDQNGVPAEPPLEVELDRVEGVNQSRALFRRRELCVHLLFAASTEVTSEALAVGQHCLDRNTGYFAVFVVFEDGILRGKFVQEADMLSRDAAISVFHFALHLGPSVPRRRLDWEVPGDSSVSSSRLQLESCGNVFLLRYGDDDGFVVAFPQWSVDESAWVIRSREDTGNALLPPLSPMEFPNPVVVRMPYRTMGYSVSISNEDLLLLPQRSDSGLPVIVESLTALLSAAIYAEMTSAALTEVTGQDPNGLFSQLFSALSASHRSGLQVSELGSAARDDTTARRSADLLSALGRVERCVSAEEARVDERQAALRAKFRKLADRHVYLSNMMGQMNDRVAMALLHRGGVKSLIETNDVLGQIQVVLDRIEEDSSGPR